MNYININQNCCRANLEQLSLPLRKLPAAIIIAIIMLLSAAFAQSNRQSAAHFPTGAGSAEKAAGAIEMQNAPLDSTDFVATGVADKNENAEEKALRDTLDALRSRLESVRAARREVQDIVLLKNKTEIFLEEVDDIRSLGFFVGFAQQENENKFHAAGYESNLPIDALITQFQGFSVLSDGIEPGELPGGVDSALSAASFISPESYLEFLQKKELLLKNRCDELSRNLESN